MTINGGTTSLKELLDCCVVNLNETSRVFDDKKRFDFEKIIPVPGFVSKGDLVAGSWEDISGRNWYEWSVKNWGTKWNSYYYKEDKIDLGNSHGIAVIRFDTAWSIPDPILSALARWFSELNFYHEFFDEGYYFFGYQTFVKGERAERCFLDDRKEDDELFKRLCIELKEYDPDEDDDEE